MKTNFKKLSRGEQLMVNGSAFDQKLICRHYPMGPGSPPAGPCITLNIPNGNPCQYGGETGALVCSGLLGGAASGYYVGNNFSACFC